MKGRNRRGKDYSNGEGKHMRRRGKMKGKEEEGNEGREKDK